MSGTGAKCSWCEVGVGGSMDGDAVMHLECWRAKNLACDAQGFVDGLNPRKGGFGFPSRDVYDEYAGFLSPLEGRIEDAVHEMLAVLEALDPWDADAHRGANATAVPKGTHTFLRLAPGSERCVICGKHISRHYGGTEYRCYAYECAPCRDTGKTTRNTPAGSITEACGVCNRLTHKGIGG